MDSGNVVSILPYKLSSSHFKIRTLKNITSKLLKNKFINNESYFLKTLRNIRQKKNSNNFIMTSVLLFLFLMPISFLFLGKNQQVQSWNINYENGLQQVWQSGASSGVEAQSISASEM